MTSPVSPVASPDDRGAIDPDAPKHGSVEESPSVSKPDKASEVSVNVADARVSDPSAPPDHHVAVPAKVLHRVARIESRFSLFNTTWLIIATLLVPIVFAVVWFGLVPVGSPQGDFKDKAVWVFVVNPITMSFLSYLLISLFFVVLDSKAPWRPFWTYCPILVVNFLAQLLMPGLVVLFHGPFGVLALPTIALCVIVTLLGLRATPQRWFGPGNCFCPETEGISRFPAVYHTFKKICIVFVIYAAVLALFMIAQVQAEGGVGQGFVTVAINVLAFIFKKILLAMTDKYDLESAMVIAGLWVENLTDVFIVVAFPAVVKFGPTFAIVFFTRLLENIATMAFQINAWFKFRVWIKGKFKPDQKVAIEEDLDDDDRGHSNSHPGYRRRQFRFFVWKMLSQLESYLFYLILAPVLRFGPNKKRFPFSSDALKFSGTHLKDSLQALTHENYKASIAFAGISLLIVLLAAALAFAYMRYKHPYILQTLAARYDAFIISAVHYSLVLSILVTNALISMMYLNVYYRVYFF